MNKKLKLIYLILILTFNFSCVDKKSTESETNKSELVATVKTDTLKFTSAIRAIFQDSKGNYWFGSHNEGVSLYDGNSFKYFTTNDGLADNQIRYIQQDRYGNIWFGTANGVSSYDGKTLQKHSVFENSESEWTKTDVDLWFDAGTRQGVYKFNGQKLNYLPFPNSKNTTSGSTYAVTSISKGKNNMLWFGTYAAVWGYNGMEFTTINDETLRITEDTEKLHVRSILEDSKGRLWIGNNGIGVLYKEGNSIINFSKKHHLIHPKSKQNGDKSTKGTLEHVFTIAEDKKGNIWFGDRDTGIWKYDGHNLKNYTIKDGLSNDFTLSIYEDKDNELWFGMADGSIYKFNGKAFEKQF